MRRTRSVLEHFAQTVGLDVLLVLGVVLLVAFKVWPSKRGIAVNFFCTRDFIERRPCSSDHLDHPPRFDQQHPNVATEPLQNFAATGSPNIYNGGAM